MRRTGANNKVFCDKCMTMPTCLHGQCTAYLCLDGVSKQRTKAHTCICGCCFGILGQFVSILDLSHPKCLNVSATFEKKKKKKRHL